MLKVSDYVKSEYSGVILDYLGVFCVCSVSGTPKQYIYWPHKSPIPTHYEHIHTYPQGHCDDHVMTIKASTWYPRRLFQWPCIFQTLWLFKFFMSVGKAFVYNLYTYAFILSGMTSLQLKGHMCPKTAMVGPSIELKHYEIFLWISFCNSVT